MPERARVVEMRSPTGSTTILARIVPGNRQHDPCPALKNFRRRVEEEIVTRSMPAPAWPAPVIADGAALEDGAAAPRAGKKSRRPEVIKRGPARPGGRCPTSSSPTSAAPCTAAVRAPLRPLRSPLALTSLPAIAGNVVFTPDGNSLISPVGNRVTVFNLASSTSVTLPFEHVKGARSLCCCAGSLPRLPLRWPSRARRLHCRRYPRGQPLARRRDPRQRRRRRPLPREQPGAAGRAAPLQLQGRRARPAVLPGWRLHRRGGGHPAAGVERAGAATGVRAVHPAPHLRRSPRRRPRRHVVRGLPLHRHGLEGHDGEDLLAEPGGGVHADHAGGTPRRGTRDVLCARGGRLPDLHGQPRRGAVHVAVGGRRRLGGFGGGGRRGERGRRQQQRQQRQQRRQRRGGGRGGGCGGC